MKAILNSCLKIMLKLCKFDKLFFVTQYLLKLPYGYFSNHQICSSYLALFRLSIHFWENLASLIILQFFGKMSEMKTFRHLLCLTTYRCICSNWFADACHQHDNANYFGKYRSEESKTIITHKLCFSIWTSKKTTGHRTTYMWKVVLSVHVAWVRFSFWLLSNFS